MYRDIDGILVWGDPLDNAVDQMRNCLKTAEGGILCADHHVGYAVPIGGVVAYSPNHISPSGVGYDIACGNKAVRLDVKYSDIRDNIQKIMDEVWKRISFGIGRHNKEDVDHALFYDDAAWDIEYVGSLKDMSRNQLGTVGSGNHYVDIFKDENDDIWIGVHFGSRGLGHKIANHYITAGGGSDGMNVDPVVLDLDTELGSEYLASMELAGRYAYAGRDWVCDRVSKIIGANVVEEIHNHHNFAWKETHFGSDYWIVRKGATPAFPGQKGFVGASMGEISVILEGVDSDESRAAMYSTVHGAGRLLSRTQAAGKRKKRGEKRIGGIVDWNAVRSDIAKENIILKGGGADEAPECYKRLDEVLEFHKDTVRIVHKLEPIGVAMAGEDTFDPYKD